MRLEPVDPPEEGPVEQACAWCLRLADGSLTPAEQQRFDAWLEADDAHRQAFDDAIRAWRAVEQASATPELVHMRTAALTSFRRGQRARWMSPRRPWPMAAAALALVVGLGFGGLWLHRLPQTYRTAVGERRVVILADGSKVSLDAATRVEVRYLGDRRELHLDYGRAKFTVARNPARPFTVAAANKLVLATGTEFSVELVHDQVQVVLLQGHVAVLNGATAGAAAHVALAGLSSAADAVLTPGRELVVPIASDQAQVVAVDPVHSLAWEGGQLVFVDEPLGLAVERINRYSADKLAVGDPAAARLPVSGVFTAGDTAAFVEGIAGVFPVDVQEQGGKKVFTAKAIRQVSQ